jgi:prepilin-type N-terminal cleavage/methylation domain-containing protein
MGMRQSGYTLIELMVAVSIMAVASIAAGMAIYQVMGGTEDNNDHMTAIHQVQNAGYWISRDAQMAVSVNTTDDLSFPGFLQLGWTEWDDEGTPIYHLAEYLLEESDDNIYSLKRSHSYTGGETEEMMVASYIYYQQGAEYTSNSTYDNPVVVLNLTSIYNDFRETREYRIKRRAGI